MRAIKQEEERVLVSSKNDSVIKSISTFQKLSKSPHSDNGVKMGITVNLIRPTHHLHHLKESSIRKPLQTATEG